MPSRRQILLTVSGAALTSLTGCSAFASNESATTDCRATISGTDDGEVLKGGVHATVEGDDVRLAVPLAVETVTAKNVDRLIITDAAGEDTYIVPVSPNDADVMAQKQGVGDDQLLYEQYVGHRPFHGHYTITAQTRQEANIDTITVEFNCFPDSDE